jgi:hypothetical protein
MWQVICVLVLWIQRISVMTAIAVLRPYIEESTDPVRAYDR